MRLPAFACLALLSALPACKPAAEAASTPQAPAAAELERILDAYLAAAQQRVAAPACLQRDQRQWQQEVQARCGADAQCLAAERVRRARALEGVVAGAALAPALDAFPGQAEAVLLAVVGGTDEDDPAAEAMAGLQPASFDGRPLEAEGGYVLVDEGFDQAAFDEFNALLGDEQALRRRFGDGPVRIEGLKASFPGDVLDVGDRAALQQLAASGQRLRARGWAYAAEGEVPALDARRCLFLYQLPPPA